VSLKSPSFLAIRRHRYVSIATNAIRKTTLIAEDSRIMSAIALGVMGNMVALFAHPDGVVKGGNGPFSKINQTFARGFLTSRLAGKTPRRKRGAKIHEFCTGR
jgi:hypothetical protein